MKAGKTLASLLVLGAAAAGAYCYLLDDDAKRKLAEVARALTETARAIGERFGEEAMQVVKEDPELSRVHQELSKAWADLGF